MNRIPHHDNEPGDNVSPLPLTEPGSGLTTATPWPKHLHDKCNATIEQADRYDWQIGARAGPGPKQLKQSDLSPFCEAAGQALLGPRRACTHAANELVPTILAALTTPVEVCFSEQCLQALRPALDTELFYGEYCSICGDLDAPTRLELVHVAIPWGQLWMLCCAAHFEPRADSEPVANLTRS